MICFNCYIGILENSSHQTRGDSYMLFVVGVSGGAYMYMAHLYAIDSKRRNVVSYHRLEPDCDSM